MYCQSDIDILLKACWKFRELFMHSTRPDNPVDPFDYTTIASIGMGMFRANCLPKEWEVLLKTNASPKCTHHCWICKCVSIHARKITEMSLWKFCHHLEIGQCHFKKPWPCLDLCDPPSPLYHIMDMLEGTTISPFSKNIHHLLRIVTVMKNFIFILFLFSGYILCSCLVFIIHVNNLLVIEFFLKL